MNNTIPLHIWTQVGVNFDEKIMTNRYRRLQTVYQQYDYFEESSKFLFLLYSSCRTLKTSKSDESYIPCTLAYLRISTIILFNEQSKVIVYFYLTQ